MSSGTSVSVIVSAVLGTAGFLLFVTVVIMVIVCTIVRYRHSMARPPVMQQQDLKCPIPPPRPVGDTKILSPVSPVKPFPPTGHEHEYIDMNGVEPEYETIPVYVAPSSSQDRAIYVDRALPPTPSTVLPPEPGSAIDNPSYITYPMYSNML